jgi:hypothetical protein
MQLTNFERTAVAAVVPPLAAELDDELELEVLLPHAATIQAATQAATRTVSLRVVFIESGPFFDSPLILRQPRRRRRASSARSDRCCRSSPTSQWP